MDWIYKLLKEVFPNSHPLEIAIYFVILLVFVWLFKELKSQYIQEIEQKNQRIDKTIEVYGNCITSLIKYSNEDLEINLYEVFVKAYPYTDSDLFNQLKKCIENHSDETIRIQTKDLLFDEIRKLKYKNNHLNNHNEDSLLELVSSYLISLKKIYVPFLSTILFWGLGWVTLLFYLISKGDKFIFITTIVSFSIFLFMIIAIADIFQDRRFGKNKIRYWMAVLIFLIAPLISLFFPKGIVVCIAFVLLIIGFYLLKSTRKILK